MNLALSCFSRTAQWLKSPWLMSHLLMLCIALPLAVHAAEKTLPASNYRPSAGSPFFLLSDATYGSNETAFVRFETSEQSGLRDYDGVDIRIYKIAKPVEFLQAQKNLHRIDVNANYGGEGLSNTITYLMDSWIKKSRMAWQGLFSSASRGQVTKEAPALQTQPHFGGPSQFRQPNQFKPIAGLPVVDQFRYPVLDAKVIAPPKDLKLAGSSSEFIRPSEGNVLIPLGKRAPGLYLVEGIVGGFRAVTLVFVSDTIAITKVASQQMLVWAVRRSTGAAVPNTQLTWTDGSGVLQSGATDARGLASFERAAPEQTWVFGLDPQGGVFISENFYYDSEIYNTKLYAVTDRPLYRPGDQVFIKMVGRQFQSSLVSQAMAAGEVEVSVIDPNGMPISSQKTALSAQEGADTSFRLPDNAQVGGYELRVKYQEHTYLAAFRVAQYQKPHFEIALVQDKANYKTGQAIKAKLQLTYPDGKPVKDADVQVTVRGQQLTMVEGDLAYGGQFPLKLTSEQYTSNSKGVVELEMPPAKVPSRYILTVFATDGAAYRVKLSKELLIERASNDYILRAKEQVSQPQEKVSFKLMPQGPQTTNKQKPAQWEAIKLEDRSKLEGKLGAAEQFDVQFAQAGSYTVTVKDSEGNVLAATSHWVSGEGMKALPGTIEIVMNKEFYQPGETAQALITFPEEVQQALLSMERDKVESTALLSQGDSWVKLQKLASNQYRANLPVTQNYGPNITFSVAYVKNGQYLFENHGLRVALPKIELQLKGNKEVYAPGEKVTLDVLATLGGKPVAANVALGVVDEMIYVLQPEIAPNIFDFFYHPRRNNVRTSASLNFVTYDLASSRNGEIPRRSQVNERNVKVLERPRRDEVDTAFWQPNIKTDASGRATISFIMPDALSRWRITARAMDADGVVGQKTAWLRSEKSFYVKWTSPDWMRQGDAPQATVAMFNQTQNEQSLEFTASGAGIEKTESVTLKPGINFLKLPLQSLNQNKPLLLSLKQQGKLVDSFSTPFNLLPVNWRSQRSLSLDVSNGEVGLTLPNDAANLQVQLMNGASAQFARVIDDLIEYPYGCVEQTASRMIPLGLALQASNAQQARLAPRLTQILHSQRLRLAQMAGPNAHFGWWGDTTAGDPLLTTYAYYADWRTSQILKLDLPSEHWQRLSKLYAAKEAQSLPFLHKALMLWMMKEIGLPVDSIAADLASKSMAAIKPGAALGSALNSAILADSESEQAQALGQAVLARVLGNSAQMPASSWEVLRKSNAPLVQAMLLLSKQTPLEQSEKLLSSLSAEMPTMDRALGLVWLQQALGGRVMERSVQAKLLGNWQNKISTSGQVLYQLPVGGALPNSLKTDAATRGLVAQVQFDSAANETHSLPMKLSRKLYRLEKLEVAKKDEKKDDKAGKAAKAELVAAGSNFHLVLVKPGTVLKTDELYLDEISLQANANFNARYTIVEVPLPPGASVEAGTWGIALDGAGKDGKEIQPLEKARHQNTNSGYAVPFELVNGTVTARHLLRFAQAGKYNLPASRAYRMYQPEKKAFDVERAWEKMEVQ